MFHDVLDKKDTIYNKKITTFQKAKKDNFPKGVTHDFCQKMQNFLLLILGQNEPINVSVCFR